ncbi:MAG: ribonuclease Z [Spirochaetes bacterium]|nr:ribonuclease Z [Spirochaetota bacterium]
MTVRLAFLGTGTCHSTPRNPAAAALSNGEILTLIDCGGGSYHQISRIIDPHFTGCRIDGVVLTHFHVDHVSGLADLIWGEIWRAGGPRTDTLSIAGPPGLGDFVRDRLLPLIGDHRLPFELRLMETADGDSITGPFFSARAVKLHHGEQATGWLFTIGGTRLAVTGDTGMCDNLPALLSESDIAIIEWSTPGESGHPLHLAGPDITRLLESGFLPGEAYFTHIYLPPGRSFEAQVRENRLHLGEKGKGVHFPRDLEVITIA